MRNYLIIFITLLIAGCSGEDSVTYKPAETAPAVSQKITKSEVAISPDNATAQSVITLYADASLLTGGSIDWYINGDIAESSGKTRFTSPKLHKGDRIQAIVTRNKKEHHSNEITVINTPPRIKRAEMVPALPRIGSTISVETDAYDVDGDTIHYKYKWTLNGQYISDQNFLSTDFRRDDMIVVEITPYDGEDKGNTVFIKNKIYNSTPVVTGNAPNFDGKTYTYALNATDPDGDELTYEIKEGPVGMTIDRYGKVTWEVSPSDAGTHRYTVLINDNNGGEVVVPITTRIGFNE